MNPACATHNLSAALRRVNEGDGEFLFRLYASTRLEEMALVDWDEQQKTSFLEMQFRAQSHHYETGYPGAEFYIVLVNEQPAGRLYVDRRDEEIRVMDIALLPQYRRQGIGSRLLVELLAEGERSGRRVTIHVEVFNPALRLYERLGFRRVASNGVYQLLEWTPAGSQVTSPTDSTQIQ